MSCNQISLVIAKVIAHNILAMNANRQFNITTKKKAKSTEKLSSGYRINRAADDAAGLSISEKMRRQIRGLNQASENIQDGISLCQVADGALNETHDILQRMRELSVKAANNTNSDEDRNAIQREIDELTKEVDRIANDTSFNEEIYPLLGKKQTGSTAGGVIMPLDPDYPGANVQIVNDKTISNFNSYVDGNGKTHYVLGNGTFQISDLTNAVFDISGNTCIENTYLKNVTINCAAGTNLSIDNVVIDNSANTKNHGAKTEIGAALKFTGNGNKLSCFGSNTFNGGVDNYVKYTSSYDNSIFYTACAGINVGNGTELEINGKDTSSLVAHGCTTSTAITYPINGGYVIGNTESAAIGSNFCEDGGKIVINGGNIVAYSTAGELSDWTNSKLVGMGAIGGGKNTNITINDGKVTAYGGYEFCIGGGYTCSNGQDIGSSGDVTINITGGDVVALCHGYTSAIGSGFNSNDGLLQINITGGNIIANSDYLYPGAGAAIGTGGGVNSKKNGTIHWFPVSIS